MINKLLKTAILFILSIAVLFAQTTVQGSFQHGGITRTYRVYIPAIYDSTVAVPLVLNLHGYGSNNIEQENYGDFRPIADTANFIIVHPNGTLDGTNKRFWNTFGNSSVNDLGFISALIDTIFSKYTIDTNKIYSTGMSNGGFMSYDLACYLNERITAIASVTGTMIPTRKNNCQTIHPTPVMHIHGTADTTVPYNGSSSFVSVPNLVNHWVGFNNCNTSPVTDSIPNTNTNDGCTAVRYIYENGENQSTVELYKINGGGHTWPGSAYISGIINLDFKASNVIWNFFRKYSLSQLNITKLPPNEVFDVQKINFYPNPFSEIIFINAELIDSIGVFDLYGNSIFQLSGKITEINTNGWNRGVYFVKYKVNNLYKFQKLVKN